MTVKILPIQNFLKIHYGKALKKQDRDTSGAFSVFGSSGFIGSHTETLVDFPTIIIGRKGSVGAVTYAPDGGWPIDTAFYVEPITPKQVNLRYLFYALKNANLAQHTITTSIPGLNRNDIYRTEIPLPPLPEQQRIAAILDKADALRAKCRAALAKLDTLLQATFIDMFGDPVTNPMGWEVKPMGEIAKFVGGGTPSREKPQYFTGDICWATSKDMKGEFLYDTQEHVTQEGIDNSATKLLPAGNLLVVVKSKILMHRLPVLVNRVATCFGQDLKGLILDNAFPTAYVARHMRIGQRSLIRQARGVNTEGLTLEHLRSYSLMVPPSSLLCQWKMTELNLMNQIEQQMQSEQLFNNLFQALQQRAFKGEL